MATESKATREPRDMGGSKTRPNTRGKVTIKKYANGKAFICSVCREQYAYLPGAWTCPKCGGKVLNKVVDERQTDGKVMRPNQLVAKRKSGHQGGHKPVKKVK